MTNAERIGKVRELVKEIEEGAGPYSRDPLTHAENCINAGIERAKSALALLTVEVECPNCEGSGVDPLAIRTMQPADAAGEPCSKCAGSGKVSVPLEKML